MKRLMTSRFVSIVLSAALAAPLLFAQAPAQERAYAVTLDPGHAVEATRESVEALAASYGGTVETLQETRAGVYVIRLSTARARALGADPRVQSITPLAPATNAAPPKEVVNWSGGVSYTYDGSGNVRQIGKDTFVYDHAHRLIEAKVNTVVRNYEYDRFGNRTKCAQNGGTADCQGFTVRPSNNQIVEATYDPAGSGNIVALPGHAYSYDDFNMMTRDQSAGTREFVYTADDQRIGTFTPGSRSWRWTVRDEDDKVLREFASRGGAVGTSTWEWVKDYVWRDELLLASRQPEGAFSTTYHYHLDHLGTPRRITDTDDNLRGYHDYFAFGQESDHHDEPSVTPLKFTGHERDSGGGVLGPLDYMHARYYSPLLGRFLSVDPIRGTTDTPQSWNRYTYVQNRPLNRFDPTGKCGEPIDFIGPVLPCFVLFDEVTVTAQSPGWWEHMNWYTTETTSQLTQFGPVPYYAPEHFPWTVWEMYQAKQNPPDDGMKIGIIFIGPMRGPTGPGAWRVGRFGGMWGRASLKDAIKTVAGETPVVTQTAQKTTFTNPSTGMRVVYDRAGNYFRVQNAQGKYVDQFGKPIPNNVPLVNSKATEIGVPKDVRKALTHFHNAD